MSASYPRLMGATVAQSAAADRLLTEEVALVDRSERGKLALTGPQAKELLSGQVTNDIEALTPRRRLLRRAADQQGQDAGRPARARHRRRALARHRARRAAGAVRHAAPRRGGLAARAAQAHARSRRCSRSWARTPRQAAGGELGPEHANRRAQLGGADVAARRHRPRASTSSAPPRTPSASAARSTSPVVPEAAAEVLRVESGRPRYGLDLDERDHPPGGRPQRARRELHQGLLRRPGDRRAPALQAASPTATCAACGCRRRCRRARRWCSASARSGVSARAWSRRASVRSGWRWCGARRRWGTSSSQAMRARSSLSCRSATALRLRRCAALTASPRGSGPGAARPWAVVLRGGE